jgi:membrane-bound lytic murein transglycosylase F
MNVKQRRFNVSEIVRKLLLSVIILILSTAILPSCRKAKNESNDQANAKPKYFDPVSFDWEDIKKRGSLIAIIDNSSTSYFLYKGKPMGYEYELLSRLCDHLGVKLELVITSDIDEAINKLNKGEGDIIAFNITVTKKRKEFMAFTEHHSLERQVLVQRMPDDFRSLKLHQIEKQLIRNPVDLAGKEIYVRKGSSYVSRLSSLADEIGGDILIIEDFGDIETEALIKKVADGEVEYTIADENIANVTASLYPNLDIKTPISFPQKIAWAVRKNSPNLLEEVNQWIVHMKKIPDYNVIYNKYFKNSFFNDKKNQSSYSSVNGNNISPYDILLKKAANEIDWDWRLLASQVYQESKFEVNAESWAGAVGMMQLLPETAERFGATDPYDPVQSINAGVKYLKYLDKFWINRVPDKEERIKFILASYNVGQGHVLDAYKLAKKYKKNPQKWEDNVEQFIYLKSTPQYYNDEVVEQGYCRGEEPVNYVKEILARYELYKMKISS